MPVLFGRQCGNLPHKKRRICFCDDASQQILGADVKCIADFEDCLRPHSLLPQFCGGDGLWCDMSQLCQSFLGHIQLFPPVEDPFTHIFQ